jgi:hypothetical protein
MRDKALQEQCLIAAAFRCHGVAVNRTIFTKVQFLP